MNNFCHYTKLFTNIFGIAAGITPVYHLNEGIVGS